MQNLTLAELENELAIRKATAAFEAELRKGDHVSLEVLFFLEREAGYEPEEAVKTLLNYADAYGWGVGPSAKEETDEEFFAAEESAFEAQEAVQKLTASERGARIEDLVKGLETIPVYYDGERYHRTTGYGMERWTREQWLEYEQQNGY